MREFLLEPWPWYVAGPLIGLTLPLLLLIGNKRFGVSSNLRHLCAAVLPRRCEYLQYDWRAAGAWNITFALGVLLGGLIAASLLNAAESVAISSQTRTDLEALGITSLTGLAPTDLFSWSALLTIPGFIAIVVGGFLVGFGTSWAGGCTSGHGISGLADLQLPSLIAVAAFFAGGMLTTWLLLPVLL
jgi:uncharacterized protein